MPTIGQPISLPSQNIQVDIDMQRCSRVCKVTINKGCLKNTQIDLNDFKLFLFYLFE